MTLRVAHCGTGLTGREALRAIIGDPALELVGVRVSTPTKVGVDAGTLCGLPEVGLPATDSWEALADPRPDCVLYGASTVGRLPEAAEEIARLLRRGIDVVTFAIMPMVHPPAAPAPLRELIAQACADGGASFHATGIEPGVASLDLVTAALRCAGTVDRVTVSQYALGLDTVYPIWEVLHDSMGFGKPDGHVPARVASGRIQHEWGPVVHHLADVLGLRLDTVELDWDTTTTETDLPTAAGILPAGTISGHRWRLGGYVAGELVVASQFFASVHGTVWPREWLHPGGDFDGGVLVSVEGRPEMRLRLNYFAQADLGGLSTAVPMTAMSAVNAIPWLVAASPGVYGPLAEPARAVTRQARGRAGAGVPGQG